VDSEPVWVEVEPWLQGEWSSQLGLVLTPSVSVCIDIVGCVELASFDIDIPLSSEWFQQEISPGVLGFGVPRLQTPSLVIELGEVETGRQASAQIVLENIGEADLEGVAGILGTGGFNVFPESFSATPGSMDGVVVDFWPESVGDFQADLVLESNDPYSPVLLVSLVGTGIEPVVEDGVNEEVISASIRTCGCSASRGEIAPLFLMALGLLTGLRRRS
jgi:MYXO-CTERM domain-containing protein